MRVKLNIVLRFAVYHAIFIAWAILANQIVLKYVDFKQLIFLQNNTFWFFVLLSSLMVFVITYVYQNLPKYRTQAFLGSFSIKFLAVAFFFLIQIYLNKRLLSENELLTVAILIVNYLIFTFWILFIYFKLNKNYFDR